MLEKNTLVQFLSGVGPKMSEKLERLGIKTVLDLIFYYPRRWDDFSAPQNISSLRIGDEAIIKAKILSITQNRTRRKWMSIIEVILEDGTGEIKAIWFNQVFLTKILKPGDEWLVAGKVAWDFKNKCKTFNPTQIENPSADGTLVLPVYSETEGLTSKYLRRIVKPLLNNIDNLIEDYLPSSIIEKEKLIDLKTAIKQIHFPSSTKDLEKAKERLAFDELFLIALRFLNIKKELEANNAPKMKIDEKLLRDFASNLPYKLTDAQRKAAWEIIKDLSKSQPMNRLLEGDVGSGKTVVAAMAALVASNNKLQTVWLAPTEILANQHYLTTEQLFKDSELKIGLVTSNQRKMNHKSRSMKHGKIHDTLYILHNSDLLIGTHALIQKNISIPKLGLIIIDEQHRFGVKQRAHLRQGYDGQAHFIPHLLSMTATPIPRTLALALYGDLDISIIDEMPAGRQKIETRVVENTNRQKAYDFIENQIRQGRQAFVICPLIEPTENPPAGGKINLFEADRKSAVQEFEKLSKNIFPDLKIGLLHGRMKGKEKDEVMQKFKNKKIDILVSTAVVEVGIDIPNATVMMIESAERFGLAQLHQFRGRVGRGEHQSYCFLFSDSNNEQASQRLNAMSRSNNGFELAQTDLELRGPGEVVGLRQSGLADLRMATLSDTIMVARAREAAEKIIAEGLGKHPKLISKLQDFEGERHLE